jgi:hypothetical protein
MRSLTDAIPPFSAAMSTSFVSCRRLVVKNQNKKKLFKCPHEMLCGGDVVRGIFFDLNWALGMFC